MRCPKSTFRSHSVDAKRTVGSNIRRIASTGLFLPAELKRFSFDDLKTLITGRMVRGEIREDINYSNAENVEVNCRETNLPVAQH